MSKNLVIVESPAKARTIKKYLGPGFEVLASYGHVRDLVPKEGAVDPDNGFAMRYEVSEDNEKRIAPIVKALKNAETLHLATDPDREGEAISWHLLELLKERGKLKDLPVRRVVFHEITKKAVQDAIEHPRGISEALVHAYLARRALDYLFGYNLSPLLWKKLWSGLSAGRVQSPALRMICEREDEIEAFVAREYWTIESEALKDGQKVPGKLVEFEGRKLEQFDIASGDHAGRVESALTQAAGGKLLVTAVEKKQRKRNPAAPFTTSTLQQEASRKLGFGASRTMRAAQKLYEAGYITYMRTDSMTLAGEAIAEIRRVIEQRYGKDNVPASPRQYKTKAKNAQEAHEAVRPTSAAVSPEQLPGNLAPDQLRLYDLIWKRTVACQMMHAVFDTVSVDLGCGAGNRFRTTGSTLVVPGFISVYIEGTDDVTADNDDETALPPLEVGDELKLVAINTEQHFTQPPPRYSEASLVKALEEYGIGRPSTYASIIDTLQRRKYVEIDQRRFTPTSTGRTVSRLLTEHFPKYVDYNFTAELEDELDVIAGSDKEWTRVLDTFWSDFKHLLDDKMDAITPDDAKGTRVIGTDPASGKPVSVKMGKFGPFVQIGTKDDDEKPRFASLRPHQDIATITFDEAMKLFDLPRDLGVSPEGEKLVVNIGQYGPYVRYGSKFASLPAGDDPYEVSFERALEIVAEKKKADAERLIKEWPDAGIQVLNGRYGPYITDKARNARVPKDTEPKSLTLDECRALLEKAPPRRGRFAKKATKKKATKKKATKKKATKKKATRKKTAKKKKKAAKKST